MNSFITLVILFLVSELRKFALAANDYTPYVLEVLSGHMKVLRNSFVLAPRIYNHGSVRGSARWTKDDDGTVESKTEGTLMGAVADSSASSIVLSPTTHKVSRFYIEDGELSRSSVTKLAQQKIPRRLKMLVNDIESTITALQSSLTTNRVGTLGAGITQTVIAQAVEKLELQDAVPETLCVHTSVKKDMKLNADIQKFLAARQDGLTGGNFVLNIFDFQAMGRSNQIYSPSAGQHVNLAFQREWAGIAFGDLSSVPAGAGRFVRSFYDPITKITFRVIQGDRADHLGQEFILDVQYDVKVQEEELACAMLS